MPPPPGSMPTGAMVDRSAEIKGVGWARAAAVTSLLGLLIAWLGPFAIIFVTGVELHYRGFHIGSGMATVASIEDLIIIIAVGAAFSIVALILYLVSFNALRKTGPGFGGPVALMVIGLLGLFLILVGLVLVLEDFLNAVACAHSGATSSCLDISQLAGAVLAIFAGLFFALLGWIGLVIGIYRIGNRFDSTLTKVGGILTIIPIVGLIAPILVLVGTHQILRRLRASPAPPP
jgi:hypothetical protein